MPPYTPQELNLYQGTDTWSVKQNSSDGAAGGKWTFSASGDSGAESMVFAGDLMVQSAQGSDYVVVFSDIRANEAAISAASVAFRAGDADLSDQIAALSSSAEASVAAVAQNLASETARATAAEGANAVKIQQEKSRALDAEAALVSSLTTESNRAISAEQGLSTSLSAVQASLENVISNTDAAALDSLTELAEKIGDNAANINARFARIEEALTKLTSISFPGDLTLS